MISNLALGLDLLAAAFALGATVWFFFIQSPALIKKMGKEKFIPIQMRLTIVLFKSLTLALVVMCAASLVHGASVFAMPVLSALLALIAVLLNNFVVVPCALRGGLARKDAMSREDQTSITAFASVGAGQPSKFWHRMVVLFVLAMVAGLIPHTLSLVFLHA